MSKTIRPIHAQVGEYVRIIWHGKDGMLEEMHTAPPEETWKVRMQQKKVVETLNERIVDNFPPKSET